MPGLAQQAPDPRAVGMQEREAGRAGMLSKRESLGSYRKKATEPAICAKGVAWGGDGATEEDKTEHDFQGKLLQAPVSGESQIFVEMADLAAAHPPLAYGVPVPAGQMPWKSSCTEAASTQEENKQICRVCYTTCRSERNERFQAWETQHVFKIASCCFSFQSRFFSGCCVN